MMGFAVAGRSTDVQTTRYLKAAREASGKKDWHAANLYYEKVLRDAPQYMEAVFEMAKVATVIGQTARRDSLRQRLCRHASTGRHHLWIAELLATSTSERDVIEEAIEHVVLAEEEGLDGTALREMLALRAYTQQRHALTVRLLEEVELVSPPSLLVLAQSYRQLRDEVIAARSARLLLRSLSYYPLPALTRELYQAQAYALLHRYPEAIKLLERQRRSQNMVAVETYLAETYSQWLQHLRSSTEVLSADQFVLLERGLSLVPDHPMLLRAFVALVDEAPDALLHEAFGRFVSPTMAHLALGMRSLSRGDVDQANFHFGLAKGVEPKAEAILVACKESFRESASLVSRGVEDE